MSDVIKWNTVTEKEFSDRFGDVPPVRVWRYGYLMGEPVNYHPKTGQERYLAYWNPLYAVDLFLRADRPLTIDEFQEEINNKSETILKEWSTEKISTEEFVAKLANGDS